MLDAVLEKEGAWACAQEHCKRGRGGRTSQKFRVRTIVKPRWQLPPSEAKNPPTFLGDRYDWTTGAPHDGNEWKKYRVIPRAHPSRTLVYAYFNRSRSKELFSFPGATWDRFRCTVEPSPGHIRCRISRTKNVALGHFCFLLRLGGCGSQGLYNRSKFRATF